MTISNSNPNFFAKVLAAQGFPAEPGQSEHDFRRWCVSNLEIQRVKKLEVRENLYSRCLYETREGDQTGWYDRLSIFQRELLGRVHERRKKKDAERKREEYLIMKGGTVRSYRKDRTEEERSQARRDLDKRYRDRLGEEERKRRQNERKAKSRMNRLNMASTASPGTPGPSTFSTQATATTALPDRHLLQKEVKDAAVAASISPAIVTREDEIVDDAILRELDLAEAEWADRSLTPSDLEEVLRDFIL